MNEYFVGLISGTSMDGIDAVVASFADGSVDIAATHCEQYSAELKNDLLAAIRLPLHQPQDENGQLHRRVGEAFRDAALAVIEQSNLPRSSVRAIGSHGQTLRHQPNASPPYSLQVGDADIIASATEVPTIADFRRADIEAGGQGAPLVPPFHDWLFGDSEYNRVVLNIGGISNITVLPAADDEVTGYDTGPGNGLMDVWIRRHRNQPFDRDGAWAATGVADTRLLESMLSDPYFQQPAPKSTGFEYFNADWIASHNLGRNRPEDVQTTLCELTALTIANELSKNPLEIADVYVCGGGAHNPELMRRLARNIPETKVATSAAVGLDPDWVEATAFAWLAMRTMNQLPGNLPSVTGASKKAVLGELHSP